MILGPSIIRPLSQSDIPALCQVAASAFTGRNGIVPSRYRVDAVAARLEWSVGGTGPVTLVAELGGKAVAMGQYAPSTWAAGSWELMLGCTRPDLQGKGLGHALVLARMTAIEEAGGGLVFVSSKNPSRWRRYGFHEGPFNPMTGAMALWRYVGGGR